MTKRVAALCLLVYEVKQYPATINASAQYSGQNVREYFNTPNSFLPITHRTSLELFFAQPVYRDVILNE